MTIAKHHYTKADLIDAICRAGIGAGDTVSLQVSLGRLGMPEGVTQYADIANLVMDSFLHVLGTSGTLIVPTYTYSIGRGQVFEVERTPSSIGEFTEIFRNRPDAIRSRDPMLSSAGIGPRAEDVLRKISTSCYGRGSTYDRLRDVGAKICTLGVSLYWATFRHHIEEMANVPFRYKKLFTGVIRENGRDKRESWVYFAAPLVQNCEPVGLPLEKMARASGLVKVEPVGRGELMCIGAREYFDFGFAELQKNPWLTARGPACSIAELVALEDKRVGANRYQIDLPDVAGADEMISALWDHPRDLVSEGYDAALRALASQVPMAIKEYPTGSECWTWIVPEKWTCRDARLERMDGTVVFSYRDNLLHVPSYSWPFDGVVSRQELLDHITVHPVLKEAIPYHYLFYKREWGLCCSEATRETLVDDQYRVVIDAAFSYGTLKVGESVVRGQSDACIVICGQLDHPRQANDGLSGCAVGTAVMRELAKRKDLRNTYRLLIVPETIGSMAWLSHNEGLLPTLVGGIFLEMVGLDQPVTLQHSFESANAFDRCCLTVIRDREPGYRTGPFLEVVTNDDRQFNAPGVRVPMVSISRVEKPTGRNGTWLYDQYHSELDSPELVSRNRLDDTVQLVLEIIDAWEQNFIPVPQFRGEVFLSRFGIYYDFTVDSQYGQALFDVMHAFDGRKSLVDIALDRNWPFKLVSHIAHQFLAAGLISVVRVNE